MKVTFDFEGCDESAAFFALYAGLRMYKEQREKRTPKGTFSIAAAEAAGMLEDLKEKFPKEFAECKEEYNQNYQNLTSEKLNAEPLTSNPQPHD